jgi:hypothetical protein
LASGWGIAGFAGGALPALGTGSVDVWILCNLLALGLSSANIISSHQ